MSVRGKYSGFFCEIYNIAEIIMDDVRGSGYNISALLLLSLDRYKRAAHRIKTCARHVHELITFATALTFIIMNYVIVLLPGTNFNLLFLSNDFKWSETICHVFNF